MRSLLYLLILQRENLLIKALLTLILHLLLLMLPKLLIPIILTWSTTSLHKEANLGMPILLSYKFMSTIAPKQKPFVVKDFHTKRKCKWNYLLYNEIENLVLNFLLLAPPTINDLLSGPLSKFITFTIDDRTYSGSFSKVFVNSVHLFS